MNFFPLTFFDTFSISKLKRYSLYLGLGFFQKCNAQSSESTLFTHFFKGKGFMYDEKFLCEILYVLKVKRETCIALNSCRCRSLRKPTVLLIHKIYLFICAGLTKIPHFRFHLSSFISTEGANPMKLSFMCGCHHRFSKKLFLANFLLCVELREGKTQSWR